MTYEVTVDGRSLQVALTRGDDGEWSAKLTSSDGKEESVSVHAVRVEPTVLSLLVGQQSFEVRREVLPNGTHFFVGRESYQVEFHDPRSLRSRRSKGDFAQGPAKITAPMPGKVVRVVAPEGTQVEAGAGVIVIEAMKMQNELKSPKAGVVKKILAADGAAVNAGDALAIID